jgi:hypothetical protein
MMETAEDRNTNDAGSLWRPRWRQVSGAVRRLHPKAPMGATVVVGHIVAENALGMLLVLDDDVVEAVSAERADNALRERIGEGRRLHLIGRIRRELFE